MSSPASPRVGPAASVVVGLAFALAETMAAFVTGRHPPLDALWLPVLALAIAGTAGELARSVARGAGMGAAGLVQAAVLAPGLLLVCARSGRAWPLAAALVAGVVAWLSRPGRRQRGLEFPGLAALACAAFSAATALVILARTPWNVDGRLREAGLALLALGAGALGAVGSRRFAAFADPVRQLALATTICAIGLAAGLGQRRPVIPPSTAASAFASGSPSVLLVVMDTVRRDRTSLHGYARPTTPHLERLAAHAVVFGRAVASGSYSLASHASLLTGLLPSQHGAHPGRSQTGHLALRPDVATLPQSLAARGYATAGISANHAMFTSWTGLSRALPELVATPRRACGHVPTSMALLHRTLGPRAPLPCHATWRAPEVTDAALAWIAAAGPRPFFLFANYFDAHAPYESPAEFRSRLPPLTGSGPEGGYDAAVAFVDAEVGRLVAGLDALGRGRDTVVVITSDHGELLGEAGLHGHLAEPREEVLGVPLLIALPGARGRHDEPRRAGHHDVWKLVESALEGVRPERLADTFDGREPVVLSELWTTTATDPEPRLTRVAYEGALKLVERADGTARLFDLDGAGDAAPVGPERARELVARLRSRLPPLVEPAERPGPSARPEQLEALRALGYLGR